MCWHRYSDMLIQFLSKIFQQTYWSFLYNGHDEVTICWCDLCDFFITPFITFTMKYMYDTGSNRIAHFYHGHAGMCMYPMCVHVCWGVRVRMWVVVNQQTGDTTWWDLKTAWAVGMMGTVHEYCLEKNDSGMFPATVTLSHPERGHSNYMLTDVTDIDLCWWYSRRQTHTCEQRWVSSRLKMIWRCLKVL